MQEADKNSKILAEQSKKVTYDSDELYYRILRVERMADKVKDFATSKDYAKIMADINAINQQLGSRAPSAAGS